MGEAPSPQDTWGFNTNFCTYDAGNNTLTCDASLVCGTLVAEATVVGLYGGAPTSDYTAWIRCLDPGPPVAWISHACVAIDETSADEIDAIVLRGTTNGDTLSFVSGAENLMPAHAHALLGTIDAVDNPCDPVDVLNGSFFTGGDYGEILEGSEGCDILNGNDGADMLYGRGEEDECHGGAGADRIDCGDDEDLSSGGPGNDNLCDTTCGLLQFERDEFQGDGDNDRLWYEDTCAIGRDLTAASSAGPGNDECGNYDDWGNPIPWGQCETSVNSKPTTCP